MEGKLTDQRDQSMLTWENTPMQGTAAIMEKLQVGHIYCRSRKSWADKQGLPFAKVVHKVLTLDAQPASSTIASIMVLVTGQLLVDDGQNVLQYSQMFHVSLIPRSRQYERRADVCSSFRRDRGTLSRTMFSDCKLPCSLSSNQAD
jgi:hypothetical protein